jgi:hypothetical protein
VSLGPVAPAALGDDAQRAPGGTGPLALERLLAGRLEGDRRLGARMVDSPTSTVPGSATDCRRRRC